MEIIKLLPSQKKKNQITLGDVSVDGIYKWRSKSPNEITKSEHEGDVTPITSYALKENNTH
jgi:hypothetical protein